MGSLAPDRSASKVQLTLMSLCRGNGQNPRSPWVPIVGARHIELNAQGEIEVEAASIPFHNRAMDARAPQRQGLLTLFGIRDALDELHHWRGVARNSNAQFAYLQIQVDVGVPHKSAVQRATLREQGSALRFVNVRRSAAELQKELLAQFAQWVQDEGGDAAREMSHVRHMALRPDLFERVLHEDPDFQHVDVLVIPLADRADPAHVRQVAYVRAGAAVAQQIQGSDQYHMHLPEWMLQRAPAAAFSAA